MAVVSTGSLTLYDANETPTAVLSNEVQGVPCNSDGSNPNLTGAVSTLTVLLGGTDITSLYTVTATPSSGITGNLSGTTYSVTGMTVDVGYVDFSAARAGWPTLVKRFSLAKQKQGTTGPQGPAGANGQDAPRYLGLYSYSSRGTITGMIAGDLAVLYSPTQSERGIYAYVSSTWTKQTTPTQDQIMRCMVGVLDAVRQGYGQSADYIGTGATSFETLLVNFLYAQYAMITGSIRAGTRYDQNGSEVNPSQEGVWIGANGKIKGAINDVEPDQVTPSFTRRQLFTASGSWTVPAHVKWVRVTAMGGGGGGGGSGGATDGGSVTASTVYGGNNGAAGGASSFGSYVVANGGSGGTGSGGAGAGATGQNGSTSDYIGGYNGANGGAGSASALTTSLGTGTRSSGAGGARGSSAGIYDATIELSNASGGLTKIPTISAGASKSNSASSTSGRVVSNGSAGNAGSYGGGGSGASGGCFAVKTTDDSYSGAGACGGGGGAGALRQRTFKLTEVYGQSITVTVGAGGAGGSAGGGTTALGATGGNGGDGWVLVEW
jgi:hypothetical protein